MMVNQKTIIMKSSLLNATTDMRLQVLRCHLQKCILVIVNGVIGAILAQLLKMLTKDLMIFKRNSMTMLLRPSFLRGKSVVGVALVKMS